MQRQLVLLYPEDIPAGQDVRLPAPTYLSVADDSQPNTVLLEATDGQAGVNVLSIAMLRRPVAAMVVSGTIYGQVVAYAASQLTVRHTDGVTHAPVAQAEEIAPALGFLLARTKITFRSATQGHRSRAAVHATILDRLLGLNGEHSYRSIRELLAGFVRAAKQPRPSDTLLWCCPTSGHDILCRVQHVIDFGYSVDGGSSLPSNIAIGVTFCADPGVGASRHDVPRSVHAPTAVRDSPPTAVRVSSPAARADSSVTQFADLLDALEGPSEVNNSTSPVSASARRHSDPEAGARPSHSPPRAPMRAAVRAEVRLEPKRRRTDYGAPSDFVTSVEDLPNCHGSFRPSPAQRAVHDLIAAEEHRGKSPVSFVEYAPSSSATKFVPHPAIFNRLHDLNFDVCELSILHFRRFDIHARLEQAGSGSVNMRNYSAKVDLPKVTLTPSYSDVFTALRVLNSYGHEFFDATTCRLLTAAQDFAEELDDYGPWSTTEVHALAFWFSRVLGAYRIAAAHDAEQYTRTTNKSGELVQTWQLAFQHRVCTRGLVVSRATVATAPVVSHPHRGTPPASHLRFLARPPRVRLQGAPPQHSDGEGNALLSRFPDRKSPFTQAAAAPTPRRDNSSFSGQRPQQSADKPGPRRSVPLAVAKAAPHLDGKQLYLRYISVQDCPSQSPDRCTHHFLVHFTPSTLKPAVKSYIVEKYGGLRADLLT
ncbi:hypothetical protein PF004_g4819 [Phytophthora fragariae]|uniref:Uncharacterized protein n=1 Tax=Phytophthora fragariae TaxID=53985 RepID=A0A6G0PHE3_9STRA|nr:hypothetical protein PF004_g4819 [Phytophthora fragariae]